MAALRSFIALLVVVGVLGGLALAAEWFAADQVEGVVAGSLTRELARASDDGAGFRDVEADVDGSVLLGLARGRFAGVTVTTGAGVVQGVPVRSLDVTAAGVSTDGSTAQGVTARVRAEAAGALRSQLDDELGEAVLTGTSALPPDRLVVQAPFEVPVLGTIPVEVELLLRVSDGALVVEPVRAQAAGLTVDPDQTGALRDFAVDDELPDGVEVTAVEVVDEDGTAVVVADLACTGGCAFGG